MCSTAVRNCWWQFDKLSSLRWCIWPRIFHVFAAHILPAPVAGFSMIFTLFHLFWSVDDWFIKLAKMQLCIPSSCPLLHLHQFLFGWGVFETISLSCFVVAHQMCSHQPFPLASSLLAHVACQSMQQICAANAQVDLAPSTVLIDYSPLHLLLMAR